MSNDHETPEADSPDQEHLKQTSQKHVSRLGPLQFAQALCGRLALVAVGVLFVSFFLMSQRDRRYVVSLIAPGLASRMSNGPAQIEILDPPSPASLNGFDYANASVPVEQILSGGPPVDGIPALTDPEFVTADKAEWLNETDRVIGISLEGDSRAYPLRILDQHEIVNDIVAQLPVAVTYCPLCDSAVVFDRRAGDETIEFGVSGLLYNSNVLMYDRRSDIGQSSLWSQLARKAVAGPLLGKELKTLPVELTTWQAWRKRHPDTIVLSKETEFNREYNHPSYGAYFASDNLMFPVEPLDDRLPHKTPVIAVWTDDAQKILPVSSVGSAANDGVLQISLADTPVELQIDAESQTVHVSNAGAKVNWAYSFWFAWAAIHPESELFTIGETEE